MIHNERFCIGLSQNDLLGTGDQHLLPVCSSTHPYRVHYISSGKNVHTEASLGIYLCRILCQDQHCMGPIFKKNIFLFIFSKSYDYFGLLFSNGVIGAKFSVTFPNVIIKMQYKLIVKPFCDSD